MTVTAPAGAADERLVRAIGFPTLTANIVNLTIGAGIFVMPAIAAGTLGAAAPIAYVVCAGLMGLIVSCFAAAGSRVSLSGGLYAYIEVAFGPFVGFLAGVLYWLMAAFAVSSVASAFAGSIASLFPATGSSLVRASLIACSFAVLATVNIRGVRSGARVVQVVTVAKLLPLVSLAVVGIWFVDRDLLRWTTPVTADAVGQTAIILIYAFAGVEVALVPSGEMRDPTRTVPRAVFAALAFTTTFYLIIQTTAQGLLGPELTRYASAPLAEAAARIFGATGRTLVLAGATVSMFGYMCGDMLGNPRVLYAFGRDGILPEGLARVHPRYRTPYVAIALHAALVAAIAISSSFRQLAILANVAALTLYFMSVLAAFELQRRDVRTGNANPFVLPGGPAIPALAIVVIVWLLSHATSREFAIEAGVVALAALFYFTRRGVGQV